MPTLRCLTLLSLALLLVACTAPVPGPPEAPSPTAGIAVTALPPKPVAPGSSPSPSPSPSPLAEATVRLASESLTAAHWPLLVAERKGFFRTYALRIELAADLSTAELLERVKGGRADAAIATAEAVIVGSESGPPLTMLLGLLVKPAYTLIGARGVSGVASLKGRPLAVGDPGSTRAVLLKRMLASQGLREADYTLIAVGSAETQAAAVVNGTAAAALVDYPRAAQLIGQRFGSLGLAADAAPEYQAEALVARPEWARAGDVPARLVRALLEAEVWLYDPANKQEAASILAAGTKTTPSEGIASYELLIERTRSIPRDGALNQAGVLRVIQLLGEANRLRPPMPGVERFVDTMVLDRARALRR